jgi:hypothetical protein
MTPEHLYAARCANGELCFEGLKAGLFEVSGDLMGDLQKMSSWGGLWPFRIVSQEYDEEDDTFLVEIVES